ncbi:MAG: O-antigen polymerase [bacterium]|nr:O-antigen polymerase [bacterium]
MLKLLTAKIKDFDYFNLGNSFALYYFFMFFSLPLIYLVGTNAHYLSSLKTSATLTPKVLIFLLLGLVSFTVAYRIFRFRVSSLSSLGLEKKWKEKNVPWVCAFLLFITLVGKVIMFLNGHYLISTRLFHLKPLFVSINSAGFGKFTGYFAVPGFALIGFFFIHYFHLLAEGNPSYKLWRNFSWFVLILEVVSGFLTGNRLPVITAIMIYAVVRHYGYKKSWKHFFAVVAFNVIIIMPVSSLFERPGDMLSALKTSRPDQVILDSAIGRFSQNVVVSSVIEKTEHYSYGKNLINFFVSLGPPRFIWKEKPIISFQGNAFGREYGIIQAHDFNTNVGPTLVGDLYMNFGLLGILVGLFITGILCRLLFNFLIVLPRGSPGGVMIYAVLWPDLIKGMENDVAPVFAGIIKLAVFMYLIHICLIIDWKRLVSKIANFWRPLVFGAFIWLFIGDTARKLIPTQPWQIMLVLDMVVAGAYLLFLIDWARQRKSKSIQKPLYGYPLSLSKGYLAPILIFITVFLLSALGPYSAGLGAGLVGFRSYLWFIPLMFLGYEMFDRKEQVLRFCKILSYAAVPLLILAGIQQVFHNTDIAPLNPFANSPGFRSGDINLVSSIFGSAQRFGMVSLFLFFLGVAVRSPTALFAFASVILSGSRSAFVLSVFGFLTLLVLCKKQLFAKTSYFKVVLGILAVIMLLWSIPSFRNTVSFQMKEGIPMIGKSRIGIFAGEMREVWGNHFSWFGKGAGAFSQGVEYVGERQALSYEKSLGETGIRNLLLEMGIVGLAAFYLLWGSVCWAMIRGIRAMQDARVKAVGYAILLFAVGVLLRFTFMHGQTLNDYAVLVPLWFFIGVFFKLKSYEDSAHSTDLPARV